MGGFRIGRKHAAHTYPDSRGLGRANEAILVFGTTALDGRQNVSFLPSGFNTESPTDIFGIEMPFLANLTAMVVRQNTPGAGGNGTTLYEVLINGAPAAGLSVNMPQPVLDGAAASPIPVPIPPGAAISLRATVTPGQINRLPTNITVTLAFSPA